MKINGINVQGIKKVVITPLSGDTFRWDRYSDTDTNIYFWVKDVSLPWMPCPTVTQDDTKMIKFINYVVTKPKEYKMWISGDTINVVCIGDKNVR